LYQRDKKKERKRERERERERENVWVSVHGADCKPSPGRKICKDGAGAWAPGACSVEGAAAWSHHRRRGNMREKGEEGSYENGRKRWAAEHARAQTMRGTERNRERGGGGGEREGDTHTHTHTLTDIERESVFD
jgi:hypothetical protein